MRVVIIGAGEVGYHIAKKLSDESHDVFLIDKNIEKIRRINDNLDVQAFLGSGTSPQMLRNVGIDSAELLVAATDSDEANLIACLLAKNLNPHMLKIARVNNREYLKEEALFSSEMLGVDLLINTRSMMVDAVLKLMEVPGASEVIDFVGGQVKLISFMITEDSPLANRRLLDLRENGQNLLIGAIVRGHKILIPSGRDIIKPMDLVYFVMKKSDVENTVAQLNVQPRQIKNVIIVGAGETGASIARALDNKNLNVKIIDQNGEKCKELAALLNKVIVIKGDGTDRDLLREENAGAMDMIIAMTDDEESNVLISLLAKDLGATRTITRVSKLSYMPLVSSIGLDTVINPRMAAVRAILQYIRRGRIISVAPLREEEAEAIEAEALETSDIVNVPLSQVDFPPGVIIGAVVRGDEIIIPRGDTVILPHDRIIIFALQRVVPKLEDLLTVKMEYF
ncbi:MAG: Trk system potassium transporter TrkA [Deltaproteobacteria bacterium]|nr:Trk system potassium transporter TrkA [Deltaproteobacteria bacterium]